MFKGEFVMGGQNPYVRGKKVKLYRWSGANNTRLEDFENTITPGVMGWNGVDGELLYRGDDGRLYRAKFEVIDG
jgi:hypothetical protein